jgi:hypothetical protein
VTCLGNNMINKAIAGKILKLFNYFNRKTHLELELREIKYEYCFLAYNAP